MADRGGRAVKEAPAVGGESGGERGRGSVVSRVPLHKRRSKKQPPKPFYPCFISARVTARSGSYVSPASDKPSMASKVNLTP